MVAPRKLRSYSNTAVSPPSRPSVIMLPPGIRVKTKQDLGSCVGTMMSLTYLDAAGNGLEVIAPELSRCTALEHLNISGGKVDMLSEGLSRLTKLRWGQG